MRLLLIFILSLAFAVDCFAQLDNPEDRKAVEDFIRCFKALNRLQFSDMVAYPLQRQYPIPPIQNRAEMLNRFDEVFDAELTGMITSSDPSVDWSAVGWRGIMLKDGELWIDADGRLISVNYHGKLEKQKRRQLIDADREKLHATLRNFLEPVLIASTSGFRIRA